MQRKSKNSGEILEEKSKKRPSSLTIPPRYHSERADSVKHLKRMELTFSPKSPRTHTDYVDNRSPAIALPVDDKKLNEVKNDVNALSSMSNALILEHHARRVDLFFYTLIAYYNKHREPQSGWTKSQHGKGRYPITQAAHSSLTPDLVDTTINAKNLLESDFDPNIRVKESLISGTHFMDSLNSTMELPRYVNEFDSELEDVYSCRKKSIAIIAEVTKGKMDPIEGLCAFMQMMQSTFNKIKEVKRFSKSIFAAPPVLKDDEAITLKGRLLELVKKGTFINKWDEESGTINDEYIFMLLRLNKGEIKACRSKDKVKRKILLDKILGIQKEIIESPSEHVHSRKLGL